MTEVVPREGSSPERGFKSQLKVSVQIEGSSPERKLYSQGWIQVPTIDFSIGSSPKKFLILKKGCSREKRNEPKEKQVCNPERRFWSQGKVWRKMFLGPERFRGIFS